MDRPASVADTLMPEDAPGRILTEGIRETGQRVGELRAGGVERLPELPPRLMCIGRMPCGPTLKAAADTAMVLAQMQLGGCMPMTRAPLQTRLVRALRLRAGARRRGARPHSAGVEVVAPPGELGAPVATTCALV